MKLLMGCMEEERSSLMLTDGHVQVEMEEEKEKDHETLPADGRGPEDLDLPPHPRCLQMAGAQRASKEKTEEPEAEVVEEITQPELSQLGKGPQSEEVQE